MNMIIREFIANNIFEGEAIEVIRLDTCRIFIYRKFKSN